MKEYIEPEVEIIEYSINDVIAKSIPTSSDSYGSETRDIITPPAGGGGEGGVPDIIGGGDEQSQPGGSSWSWGDDDDP